MINKANDDTKVVVPPVSGNIDIVNIDVQGHLTIKDSETGEVLLNKRG